jgi:hypothetical protein
MQKELLVQLTGVAVAAVLDHLIHHLQTLVVMAAQEL